MCFENLRALYLHINEACIIITHKQIFHFLAADSHFTATHQMDRDARTDENRTRMRF